MARPPKPTLVPFLAAGFNFASGRRIAGIMSTPPTTRTRRTCSTARRRRWLCAPGLMATISTIQIEILSRTSTSRTGRRCGRLFWTQDWSKGAGPVLDDAAHQLVVGAARPAGLLGERDAARQERRHDLRLGTRRRAVDYWSYVGVTPIATASSGRRGAARSSRRRACPRSPSTRRARTTTIQNTPRASRPRRWPRRRSTPTTPTGGGAGVRSAQPPRRSWRLGVSV